MRHDTRTPDVETAGADYARRFEGPVGEWFLQTQREAVTGFLRSQGATVSTVLEVGGGHGQLAPALLRQGYRVVVHGSSPSCHDRLRPYLSPPADVARGKGAAEFVASSLWQLPFPDQSYDAVIGVRLLAHVERWRELLEEMARVTRRFVIVDYPPLGSLNLLTPALFSVKKRFEGNTRPYFCYRTGELVAALEAAGLSVAEHQRQFSLPMGLHRKLGRPALSRRLESVTRATGLTGLIGSPAILFARRAAPEALFARVALSAGESA